MSRSVTGIFGTCGDMHAPSGPYMVIACRDSGQTYV